VPIAGTIASARDLSQNLSNWQWTWGHGLKTAANVVGLIPLARGVTSSAKAAVKGLGKAGKIEGAAAKAVGNLGDAFGAEQRLGRATNNFAAPNAAKAATQAKGGTYVLRDPATGQVMRSGRTNDLARREAEHALDPALKDYKFEAVNRTDVYAEQRGLEQMLHETYNPPLNKIGGIDPKNPRLPEYSAAAQQYFQRQQGGQ
jgi:hypothetical protein